MIVSMQQASDHLRLGLEFGGSPETADDDMTSRDLALKVAEAEAIVLDYLKVPEDGSPLWEPSERALPVIQAAIKLVLSALWDDREGAGEGDYLAENGPVARLLRRYRDPALA